MRDTDTATVDPYDRLMGILDGLQGTFATQPTTVQVTSLVGSQTFIVKSVRRQDRIEEDGKETVSAPEFTVFLEYHDADRHMRIAVPPRVADVIARQRDALTTRARKQSARRATETRKQRGIVPAFLKKGRKSPARS